MESNYAILDSSSNILNVILWDGVSSFGIQDGQTTQATPAADGSIAQPGGTFNGTSFIAPAPLALPEPS